MLYACSTCPFPGLEGLVQLHLSVICSPPLWSAPEGHRWRLSAPDPLVLGDLKQFDGVCQADNLKYPAVCLNHLLPEGQEMGQVVCNQDIFQVAVGVPVHEDGALWQQTHCGSRGTVGQ